MSILLENIQFSYNASTPVLHIPNWSVAAGERVFIIGPSGSGKSTLLNLIGGLLKPQSGNATVCGQDLGKLSAGQCDRFRANNVGIIYQQFNLISYLSAIDNIRLAATFGKKRSSQEFETAAEQLLTTLNVPQGLWRQPAAQLSIGQQQRVAIARALINKPKLLIADEPSSALDYDNRDTFIELLKTTTEQLNTSLVFVSHDRSLNHHFDRVDAMADINQVAK